MWRARATVVWVLLDRLGLREATGTRPDAGSK